MLIALTLAVIAAAAVLAPAVDAEETVQDDVIYCYGNHPILIPNFNDSDSVWKAVDEDGTEIEVQVSENGSATLDITGCTKVIVTQKVGDKVAKSTLIPMGLGFGKYVVTFYDRGYVVDDYEINGYTTVRQGDVFVVLPVEPARDGYSFEGWYTTSTFEDGTEFDPKDVVTGDIDLYAKWSATSSSGGSGSTTVGSYLVTFDCVAGLTYSITDRGSDFVSFTVSELPDYQVIEGSIEVEANGNPVSPVDGVYTVTGINTDVLITIDGDLMFSGNPNDPASDDGMPMWMWIMLVVVILLIAAAILWMRGRQVDQGRI